MKYTAKTLLAYVQGFLMATHGSSKEYTADELRGKMKFVTDLIEKEAFAIAGVKDPVK